jgi:hypothetical protein
MDPAGLSPEQVRLFRRQGFLALQKFASETDIAEVRRIYDRLFSRRAGWAQGDFFDLCGPETDGAPYQAPQMLHLSKYAPDLLASRVYQLGWDVARQILGPEGCLELDHGISKPAGGSVSTPWHQDEAFWDERYDHDGVSIWIPLQPVDSRNGCMMFAPGSHKRALLPHRPIGDDRKVHGLEAPGANVRNPVCCPLPLGGATLHHARTLHYSAPNLSAEDRRAYVLVFVGKRRRRFLAREHHWNRTKQTARAERELAALI